MNETRHHPQSWDHLPRARIEKNWKTPLFWLIPIAAALLCAWFVYGEFINRGPTVHVLFDNAQELQAGKSEVKYRGAQIGVVKQIGLTQDHRHVNITLSLDKSARNIAREGSRFWIVRAQLGIQGIEAPRTIVSGNYITVDPGGGKPQTTFTGLPEAPVIEPPGDLNIVLLSGKLGSVKQRTPVFYRGIQVGEVRSCELGPTAQTVRMVIQIKSYYTPLVRMNSKFWNAGGINFNIGLSGADISAQSAQTLISGGIAFATPDTSQPQAYPNTAYRLFDKPEEEWLAWSPAVLLDHGNTPTPPPNTQASTVQAPK